MKKEDHADQLISIIESSKLLKEIFHRAETLELGIYVIGAGCITQTVWNVLTSRPLTYGISDIDIVYFDESDISFQAEDRIVKRTKACFKDIPLPIDVNNQARVHLWYEMKFGVPLNPYGSLEEAIASWPTTATALGVRMEQGDKWHICAPFGLRDLFSLTVRPNKKLITKDLYNQKAAKWNDNKNHLMVG